MWRTLDHSGRLKTIGATGSTGPTGPSGPTGGGLSQTLQFSTSGTTNLSTTGYTNIGLSGAITPVSATDRIRIQLGVNIGISYAGTANNPSVHVRVSRGATGPAVGTFLSVMGNFSTGVIITTPYLDCIDSPATTGATTYVVSAMVTGNPTTAQVNLVAAGGAGSSYMTLSEIV